MSKFGAIRRGVTLIEAVLFISIALGVIVGGLAFYRQASFSLQTKSIVSLVDALTTEAKALMAYGRVGSGNTPDYINDVHKVLIAAGAVPGNAVSDDRQHILSTWGGDIVVNIDRSAEPPLDAYGDDIILFWLSDVPAQVCARIAWFDEKGRSIFGYRLVASYIDPDNLGLDASGNPLSPNIGGWDISNPPGNSRGVIGAHCNAGSGKAWMFLYFAFI